MQQQGGSQYGVPLPELNPPFFSGGAGSRQHRHVGIHGSVEHLQQPAVQAASPISSRSVPPASIFDDFGGGGGVVMRGISDEEALGAGEEGERGASAGGNRWPRQETLVLLKVRSEMDSAFRDATLKGPLWEDVSRKLAELGYMRSAKKCKEKFENVHKYYKRTKEGRAGRQDGKSYRFFSQLEALHSPTAVGATISSFSSPPNINLVTPQISEAPSPAGTSLPPPPAPRSELPPAGLLALPSSAPDLAPVVTGAGVSFSSNTSSSSSSDSDGGEDTDDGCAGMLHDGRRKRKRELWPPGSGGKTMAFFEGLMKELMERQEVMQQRFLDTIEKREQDRMIREEAWKRQEMARLNREYELMAQERTMAANRDAAVISFLQKFTGGQRDSQTPANTALASPEPSPEEAPPQAAQPESQRMHQCDDIVPHQPSQSVEPDTSAAAAVAEMPELMAGGCLDVISPPSLSSSRWPKAEVLALIKLRSGLDTRYMDSGPKGPLWEEISLAMKRLGYNRSTKRCKEKWENINKYFKKVKEGNKKRPEDAKTCPYYHELDALYRKKLQQDIAVNIPDPPIPGPPQPQESNKTPAAVRTTVGNGGSFEGGGGVQLHRTNGAGISQVFFGGGLSSGSGAALKKPEDIIKELMEQQHHGDEDEYDDDEEDDEEEEDEDGKMRYEIQFQSQNVGTAAGGPRSGATEKAPPPSSSNAGSFLAMVQ